jgi:hypothetical protein
MKKAFCILLTVLLFAGCATVTKVGHKLSSRSDSLSSVRKDTSSALKTDSITHLVDRSLNVTQEHIVNDINLPGSTVYSQTSIYDLLLKPKTVVSADGIDSVQLSYSSKDSIVHVWVIQKSIKQHQVIDRTITNKANVVTDTKTNRTLNQSGILNSNTEVKNNTVVNDESKVVKRSIFSSPFFIIGAILVAVVLVLFLCFKFKIL